MLKCAYCKREKIQTLFTPRENGKRWKTCDYCREVVRKRNRGIREHKKLLASLPRVKSDTSNVLVMD